MLIYSLLLSAMAEPAAENKSQTVESTGNLDWSQRKDRFAVDFEGRELESGLVFDSRLRTQGMWTCRVGNWRLVETLWTVNSPVLHGI